MFKGLGFKDISDQKSKGHFGSKIQAGHELRFFDGRRAALAHIGSNP